MDDRSSAPGSGDPSADGPVPSVKAVGEMIQQALEEARRIWEQQARDREARLEWQRVTEARNTMAAIQCWRLSRENPGLSREELGRIVEERNKSGNPVPIPELPKFLIEETQEMLPIPRERAGWWLVESDHRLAVTECRAYEATTGMLGQVLRRIAEAEQIRKLMNENPALTDAAAWQLLAERAKAGNPVPFPMMPDLRQDRHKCEMLRAASWEEYWGVVSFEREQCHKAKEEALREYEDAMRILRPVMHTHPYRTVAEALALIRGDVDGEQVEPPDTSQDTQF